MTSSLVGSEMCIRDSFGTVTITQRAILGSYCMPLQLPSNGQGGTHINSDTGKGSSAESASDDMRSQKSTDYVDTRA
eukprot:3528664-Prorocentrum_lima.AAC.1